MENKINIQRFREFKEDFNTFGVENKYIIEIEKKTSNSYNFVSKYLNIISFDDYINNENLYQVVARKNNKIVGVRIFRMKESKIHLNYSVVDIQERNKALNRKMLLKIEKYAIKNKVNIITSNVRKSNIASLNSLLKSGFTINQNYDLYYTDGEKKIPLFKKIKIN